MLVHCLRVRVLLERPRVRRRRISLRIWKVLRVRGMMVVVVVVVVVVVCRFREWERMLRYVIHVDLNLLF